MPLQDALGYGYDAMGHLATVNYPDGHQAIYNYVDGVVSSVTLNVGRYPADTTACQANVTNSALYAAVPLT